MVAISHPALHPNPLQVGDDALRMAAARLAEAREAFQEAGRADLSAPLGAALLAVREAELLRLVGLEGHSAHNPADWFLE